MPSAATPTRPATVRQIADLAGLSPMTVSRALSNRPGVAPATRATVLRIARSLGYRPDPEISKLMHYLRRGARPRFQSVLVGLTNWPPGPQPQYLQALLAGAQAQAAKRGYGFSLHPLDRAAGTGAELTRILRHRGIEGVLLLPLRPPLDLGPQLDWSAFSAVATSMSVLAPEVHRVAPHHFANTHRLCRELAALGYRRLGLMIDRSHDARVNHAFSAAVASHARHGAGESVPPLVHAGSFAREIAPWFRREQPDAIIVSSEVEARECARLLRLRPGRIGLASISVSGRTAGRQAVAGIDEIPGEIGALAVDLLAGMVERGSRGLPAAATSTLVAGRWCPGRSAPGPS